MQEGKQGPGSGGCAGTASHPHPALQGPMPARALGAPQHPRFTALISQGLRDIKGAELAPRSRLPCSFALFMAAPQSGPGGRRRRAGDFTNLQP